MKLKFYILEAIEYFVLIFISLISILKIKLVRKILLMRNNVSVSDLQHIAWY